MRNILTIFLLFLCYALQSQMSNLHIVNYSINNYNAHNQNWGIDIDTFGIVYVANNKGLLRYNGQQWRCYPLPNRTIVRSVLVAGDRIFTGSYEEIGYWENTPTGELSYHSLSHLIKENNKSEEFWQIIAYKGAIVFRSFASIYMYRNNAIVKVPQSENTLKLVLYKGHLLGCRINGGLCELKNDRLYPFSLNDEIRHFDKLVEIATDKSANKIFLFDKENGGYVYDAKQFLKLPKKLNTLLRDSFLNKVSFLGTSKIAFGTIRKGVFIYDFNSQTSIAIDKSQGLLNNTVLDIKYHKEMLWCSLDNGISRVITRDFFEYYKDHIGILGMVYDVAFFNGSYYLASNTGVYKVDKNGRFQFIEGSNGHTWNLTTSGNQLLCSHNKKSFYIEDDTIKPINDKEGCFGHFPIPNRNSFLQGSYTGINLLRKSGKIWSSQKIQGINFPVNNIVFKSDTIIWATHPYKGVYQIKISSDYKTASQLKQYETPFFKQYKVRLYYNNDTVFFYNADKYFFYNEQKEMIQPYERFQKVNQRRLIKRENNGIWLIDNHQEISFLDNKSNILYHLDSKRIKNNLVSGYEKIIVKNDSVRILNLNEGFVIFNINDFKRTQKEKNTSPMIARISANEKTFALNKTKLYIPFHHSKRLSFDVYTPNMYENNHFYNLKGKVSKKGKMIRGSIKLEKLPYGVYTLNISNNVFGKTKKSKIVTINISPPWYWLIEARIIYLFLLIELLYFIYKILKIKQRKKILELQRSNFIKSKEKIDELKHRQMKQEMENKRTELIRISEILLRKNEILMVIVNHLERISHLSPWPNRTERILEKSKKDIKNSKYYKDTFEYADKKLISNLKKINLKLTNKDLKLCIYIKNGLTSKNIAPLMGISLRGVELHRYRLRKKLNIDSETNFSLFLQHIKD